nr:hypothetical protein GCM10010200_100730 [Actinomadura rugatobispora]
MTRAAGRPEAQAGLGPSRWHERSYQAPADTVQRELEEEFGIEVQLERLLCVDWVPPHTPWDDSLMFIFDGGVLTSEQEAVVALSELSLSSSRTGTSGR